MIKVLNSANETQCILENIINPIITEEINREFILSFTTVIDGDKSDNVIETNKIEADGNYFNIVYYKKQRTADGLFISANCEHVSYSLINEALTAGFTATGQFSAIATTLFSGTGFTVGTVEITASETISINEATNKRYVLMQLAELFSGELKFDKYEVSLLTRRGADRGVQFRYRKNLLGVTKTVDNRTGTPVISYEVDVAELDQLRAYGDSEHYELGDTVLVYDTDLDINVSTRIVKYVYDVEDRTNSEVTISTLVPDFADTISTLQKTTVVKDRIYNGCSIGPEDGFVAERSDSKAKTIMNATEGISIYGDTGGGLTRNFYVDINGVIQAKDINISSSGTFGGSITIGSGNNVFKADSNGIYLGNATFASAPFRVTMTGAVTASNLNMTGGSITAGQITVTSDVTVGNTIYVGSAGAYNKNIVFFNSGGDIAAINLSSSGTLGVLNTADIIIASDDDIDIIAGSSSVLGLQGLFISLQSTSFNAFCTSIKLDCDYWSVFGVEPYERQTVTLLGSKTTVETAGASYTSNEQDMLNHLKADVQSLYDKVNGIMTRLSYHGIFNI